MSKKECLQQCNKISHKIPSIEFINDKKLASIEQAKIYVTLIRMFCNNPQFMDHLIWSIFVRKCKICRKTFYSWRSKSMSPSNHEMVIHINASFDAS